MPKVLVVEDDVSMAKALVISLRSQGHQAEAVYDASSGVTEALKSHPDVVLLDINMPAGGGLSAAARITNVPETSDIPIIFLTASKSPQIHAQAEAFEPVALLETSGDPEQLLAAIYTATHSGVVCK